VLKYVGPCVRIGFFIKGVRLMNLRVDKLVTLGAILRGGPANADVFEATILNGVGM